MGMGDGGWIAGPKCGTRMCIRLLPGYEEGGERAPMGQKIEPILTICIRWGQLAAAETSNKTMCGAFLIGEHIPRINLGLL